MYKGELTLLEIAEMGLGLDDPYGDGTTLQNVRRRAVGRQDAINLVLNRQYPLDHTAILEQYESVVRDSRLVRLKYPDSSIKSTT